jgi:putative ABC transport system permease protein
MLGYYIRLAFKSFRRAPGLTALMVGAIAFGIAACIVTLTVHHAMGRNPIWWKNNVLYAVTMDSWDPREPYDASHPNRGPSQLTYRDATYLYGSKIPKHKALLSFVTGTLAGAPGQAAPSWTMTRITDAGFFRMFDVPFEYGGPWSRAADEGPEPVIVLSRHENDKLFDGRNSVGRTILWNHLRFRIVGVLNHWDPKPRFYDLTGGGGGDFGRPARAFVPFKWGPALHLFPNGSMSCWDVPGSAGVNTYQDLLGSNCVWILMWVELPTRAARQRFLNRMNAYWAEQRTMGRFQRPRNNHLWKVSQWLRLHHIVSNDSRLLVRIAFAFLAVCLINTVGILLAKFLRGAPLAGVRRALGATRRQIFTQHLVEVAMLALVGSAVGLILGLGGLAGVRVLYAHSYSAYGKVAHFDLIGIAWALALAAVSTLVAGLYPAWRIGRVAPARYLKSQ